MVETRKFSEFIDGGTFTEGDVIAGLSSSENTIFTASTQFLEPGTTAQRPASPTEGMIRYNTDLNVYEFYDGTIWQQIESSGDISNLIARLAAHTPGDGASMIGLQDQGAVSGKTVQDMSEADFIVKNDTTALLNAFPLSSLATGFLSVETATGDLVSREVLGTTNEIVISNGTGLSGNPAIGIADNPILPGTSYVGLPSGDTAGRPGSPVEGYSRYNTDTNEVEYYNGSGWVSLGAVPGTTGLIKVTVIYNVASGTFTPDANTSSIYGVLVGGGGGGGGAAVSTGGCSAGGGGGAGGRVEFFLSSVSGTYDWILAEGGAGGSNTGGDGDPGTDTSFTDSVTIDIAARGGEGGLGGNAITANAPKISAELAYGGDVLIILGSSIRNISYGGNGLQGIVYSIGANPLLSAGIGGTAGGYSAVTTGYVFQDGTGLSKRNGYDGNNYGDGGGGGYSINDAAGAKGGVGSWGVILLYEYA